jgi:hypothetical protein
MKPSYKLLTELIPLIEEYEATNQKVDMQHFLKYAVQKHEPKVNGPTSLKKDSQLLSNQLGFFLNYLFRFFKGYTKTALRNSSISTSDDFVFDGNAIGH